MKLVSRFLVCVLIGILTVASVTESRAATSTMKIVFNGYNQPGTLTNFPVLVVFTDDVGGSYFAFNRYPFLNADGYELRFWNASQTVELHYEIEKWDTNGSCFVWVRVPSISASTDFIWAKWGDPANTNQQPYTTDGSVWDSSFAGVWHMNQSNALDYTANHNNGVGSGNTSIAGAIGDAQSFSATNINPYIVVPSSPGLEITGQLTMEVWVKRDDLLTAWQRFMSKKVVYTDDNGYELEVGSTNAPDPTIPDSSQSMQAATSGGSNGQARVNLGIPWDTDNWHHVAATISGTNCQIYFDGKAQVMTKADCGPLMASSNVLVFAGIGGDDRTNGISRFFGQMDEIRISNTARDSKWIAASYMTVASNISFSTYRMVAPTTIHGIPYAWLTDHGLATADSVETQDPDGDGYNNLQEYIAKTDPNDPLSYPRLSEAAVGSLVRVDVYPPASQRLYRIYGRRDMISAPWQLQKACYGTGGIAKYLSDPTNDMSRCFRASVSMP